MTSLPSTDATQRTTSKLGAWLAAALDDPNVCAEMKADIEAWMNAGEPAYGHAMQVVDREAVAWPESPIAIAQRGFEKWRAKEHNKKWFRKIDGTPIPNDVVVCIAQEFADTACPVMPVRQETADTSAALLQRALEQALNSLAEIAAAHIPDCPAHYAGDELSWAQRHVGCLRQKAEIARDGIAAAIRQLPTTELVNPEKMYSYDSEAKVEFEK